MMISVFENVAATAPSVQNELLVTWAGRKVAHLPAVGQDIVLEGSWGGPTCETRVYKVLEVHHCVNVNLETNCPNTIRIYTERVEK